MPPGPRGLGHRSQQSSLMPTVILLSRSGIHSRDERPQEGASRDSEQPLATDILPVKLQADSKLTGKKEIINTLGY